MNLIYISNTRVPSEKANTYQSFVMCEAFSKYFESVEFWHPKRKNTSEMDRVKSPFEFYSVNKIFDLKQIYSFDFFQISMLLPKIWFLIQNITFAITYMVQIRKKDLSNIIFTRDVIGLKFLSLAKKYGFIKQRVYFEAHTYSYKVSQCCKYMDGLVVINQYLKNLYEEDDINNILIAHDGVKLDEYVNIKEKEKEEIFNIVYTGNLFKWKGVYTLVDSLKYLEERVKLIIVGGSNDTLPQFKQYVKYKNIKNIEIVGFVQKSETIPYIQKADVLLLPNSSKDKMSYYTSPLKLFEYMASKRPIVASRLPSIQEVLKDNKNAILCEPDNPQDLAKKIQFVLENDCKHLVTQAYEDVQEYTWDKRAKKIVKWIRDEINN